MSRFILGQINKLSIVRFCEHGAFLDGGSKEILMPKKYVLPEWHIGDEVEVFVYLDQEKRLVATTETPCAVVGQFAYLRVSWVNRYGSFMDWGLTKDLFVPFGEQRHHFQKNKSYLVYIYIDDMTGRIVGTSKLDRNLRDWDSTLKEGDKVEILVWKKTDLGYKVIVENAFEGLVYSNEIFQPIHIGMKIRAFIKYVREDGKVDIALQKAGKELAKDTAAIIMDKLNEANGFLPFGDHSDADEIAETFHVSKKAFKRAIGSLYKDRLITIEEDGIHIASKTANKNKKK